VRDLRLALRLLRLRPGFCAAVVLTLAIALGSTTAIFSVVNALILRPLPFPDPDRLVEVTAVVGGDQGRLTLLEYRDLARDTRMFEGWGAFYRSQYNVTGGGPPEALTCTIASSTIFSVLGVRPVQGEVWPETQDFTRQFLVMLSHRVWQQRFGGRLEVVGSTILMDGAPYLVTGVLPEGFDFPVRTDVFRSVTDYNAPHVRRYSALARIRAGRTLADAQAELDAFSTRFAEMYPQADVGIRLRATPLRDGYVGRARPFVLALAGAVVLLFVIAAVNVTNLLVSRAVGARPESAVRLALGAERRHLVRQSVAEALVLTGIGALLGIVSARLTLDGMMSLVRLDLPPWFSIQIDRVSVVFAMSLAIATALAVAVGPAFQSSSVDLERALRQEPGRTAGHRRTQHLRRILLGSQATFATLLLVMAGMLTVSLRDLLRVDPGFEPSHVLTFRVDPPFSRYPDIATTSEYYRRATESLAAMPGAVAAGANTHLPFSSRDTTPTRIAVEGHVTGRADEEPFANVQLVDTGYFRAMQIPLMSGRLFDRTDRLDSTPVGIVSARTARRLWGSGNPLGRRLRVVWNQQGVGGAGGSEIWLTVVGVVGDVCFSSVDDVSSLNVYAPDMQLFAGDSYLVVRTLMAPDGLRSRIRAALDQVDSEQSFFEVDAMPDRVRASFWQHRVASSVLAVFAGIALCLAVIGTYAVTAHAVTAQRREIGIRLALGSPSSEVVQLVLRRWMVPIGLGVLAGMVSGAVLGRSLGAVIGVTRVPDFVWPLTLPLVLCASAALACYLPIRRTVRHVGLTMVLRAE
jgi:putative ABC transport system permease protein